jgi:5-formyltetrahydrofolate cyclo-ligase
VIATGYELCRIPSIDPQLHDIPMDWLVTERGLYRREASRLVFQDLP